MSSAEVAGVSGTRAALLDAAVTLLTEGAPEELSMGSVAGRAGVSRQAVYLHFKTRAELVLAAVEHANRTVGLAERIALLLEESDPRRALRRFAELAVWHAQKLGRTSRAVWLLLDREPELAARWALRSGRRGLAAKLVTRLAGAKLLRPGLSRAHAASLLHALTHAEVVLSLTASGLSAKRASTLLGESLEQAVCVPLTAKDAAK